MSSNSGNYKRGVSQPIDAHVKIGRITGTSHGHSIRGGYPNDQRVPAPGKGPHLPSGGSRADGFPTPRRPAPPTTRDDSTGRHAKPPTRG